MNDLSPNSMSPLISGASELDHDLTALVAKLKLGTEATQLQLIHELAMREDAGEAILMEFLLERKAKQVNFVDGAAYQVLLASQSSQVANFLQTHFPAGVVPLWSEKGIDYVPLQQLLVRQDFQAADRLTLQKLCELAGKAAVQRKWLYFSEVRNFPIADLRTIDALWFVHSEGKFGYSVQRQLWLSVGKNWPTLWSKLGWKTNNDWTRYPHEFTWDLTAPKGHLPLSNQLRGVQVFSSLLTHPAWQTNPN